MAGPIPITMTDIDAYARYRGINSPEERDRLLNYLRILDQEWMTNHYSEQKKRGEDPKKTPSLRKFHQPR